MSHRTYEPDLLPGPDTLRVHFTPTGRVKGGGRTGLGLSRRSPEGGDAYLYAQGPLGWWHDFQVIPITTSFDDAVRMTYLPAFYGWDKP